MIIVRLNKYGLDSSVRNVSWVKARRCAIQTCVEVKRTADAVYIRDSKQVSSGDYLVLSTSHVDWVEFLTVVQSSPVSGSTDTLTYSSAANGDVRLTGEAGVLTYDAAEWSAFLDGVRDGDFALEPATVA